MYSERKLSEYMAEPSASRGTKTASSGTYATNEVSIDMEQSQKLRSLHQVSMGGPTDPRGFSAVRNTEKPSLQHLPPPKPQHRTINPPEDDHYDKLGATGADPNPATSLLKRSGFQHNPTVGGNKYGTTSSYTQSRKSSSIKRNLLRLQPALFHRFKRESNKSTPAPVAMPTDRRNEFFTLKRLIFLTLGMPSTPAITSHHQKACTCLAVPLYVLLYIWGIGIFVVAMQSDGWIWSGVCPDILPAKLLTMLAGLFFVLLGLYWLLVLWWSRPMRSSLPLHLRNFSTMALLWWVLCMYFVGVASALAVQVIECSDLIMAPGSEGDGNVTLQGGIAVQCDNGDLLEVPNNMVPLWALCSMGALWLIYILVFIVATVTIYTTP